MELAIVINALTVPSSVHKLLPGYNCWGKLDRRPCSLGCRNLKAVNGRHPRHQTLAPIGSSFCEQFVDLGWTYRLSLYISWNNGPHFQKAFHFVSCNQLSILRYKENASCCYSCSCTSGHNNQGPSNVINNSQNAFCSSDFKGSDSKTACNSSTSQTSCSPSIYRRKLPLISRKDQANYRHTLLHRQSIRPVRNNSMD